MRKRWAARVKCGCRGRRVRGSIARRLHSPRRGGGVSNHMGTTEPAGTKRIRPSPPVARPAWKETQFEHWFLDHPELPGDEDQKERVLVIARNRPVKRMVDIVALDRDGGLVIIEVKNERSTRLAIGRVLEYLSSYQDVSLAELVRDTERDLQVECRACFGVPVRELTNERRIVIAAPSFDVPSAVMIQYLDAMLKPAGIHVSMLQVERNEGDFELSWYRAPNLVSARHLAPGLAVSPGGRLFWILERGPAPAVWFVGRQDADGRLVLPSSGALARSGLQVIARRLVPVGSHEAVSVEKQGQVWVHKSKPGRRAVVLGEVTSDGSTQVVFVRMKNGAPRKVRRQSASKFSRDWLRSDVKRPEWHALAKPMANEHGEESEDEAP